MARNDVKAIPREKPTNPSRLSPLTDESRWRLVLAHTPTTNFLYGVVSTRIFCRTSCPSRRPRRANVRFFDSAASAVAAGFRPCRRCRPESTDPSHESPRASAEKQVVVACEYLRRRKGDVQMLELAAHVGLSPRYLHGLFKRVTGTTPGAYAAAAKRESTEAHGVRNSPVLGIRPELRIVDCPGATDFVPVDDSAWEISLRDFDSFNDIAFNSGGYPEWVNCDDPDVTRLMEGGTESLGQLTDTHVSDCADPSLLSS